MRAVSTSLDTRSTALHVEQNGTRLSWSDTIAGLQCDIALRTALTDALVAVPFAAYYWEARPVSPSDGDATFESVVLDAPALARGHADFTPFHEPLGDARAPAVRRFPNLSGDAELIVPAPGDNPAGYPHLAAFLRTAPTEQIHALWIELARGVTEWLDTRGTRVWVSTAGLGVSWLHLRLDSRPKYVKWSAYR